MTERDKAATRWLVLALALVPLLLPFVIGRKYLSDDAILYGFDHAQLQYPRFAILCDALQKEHAFPLWQRTLYAGGPFHANPETPTLYPPVLLMAAFLPPVLVMNLVIVLHLSLAGLGMFVLVRRLWRRMGGAEAEGAVGALLAALVFGCCNYTRLEHFNLVSYGAAHALIPWIMLAADALLHGSSPRRAAGCLALLVAAQVFTGGLYVYAYTALGLVLWLAVEAACGGAELRRRLLVWGGVAALAAGLLAAAKLAAFPHWVALASRGELLSAETVLGVTLGGHGSFSWSAAGATAVMRTGAFAILLLPLALPLLRRSTVRAAGLVLLVGFLVALGGPVHAAIAWLPPFDRIRNADRAWTLCNAMLPLLAGLGLAWLLSRIAGTLPPDLAPRPARPATPGRRRLALGGGVVLALLLLPRLLDSGRHTAALSAPLSLREVLQTRYPHWQEVARQRGDARAMQVDVISPGARNEQFVAAALGLEIVGGMLGNSWPLAVARHAYEDERGPLEAERRRRRLGILAVGWLVTSHAAGLRDPGRLESSHDALPLGIDGTAVERNEWARPRAFQPASVVGIFGDRDQTVQYLLLDLPRFPLAAASVAAFAPGESPSADELAALDEILIVDGGDPIDAALAAQLSALEREQPGRVHHVGAAPSPALFATLAALCQRLAARGAGHALPVSRPAAGELDVDLAGATGAGAPAGAWVVLAETFAVSGGWLARAEAQALPLRRADGIASAVHVPAGARTLHAEYAPPEVRLGWVLGAAGLVLASALLLVRERRADARG